ncbi:hypothetical protein D9611_003727 [Ephemerocybe angulata]|uniref:Uncharacterized protein n=1 Tax=Ephemerocybe angulata TaxID=980116 RepID=A0A8H5EZ66_9AGAR|nr:hypothetical protein D9611_003727 [Tulosesus angulatus]
MSLQIEIGPALLLCAALLLYSRIKSLHATITALTTEILKKDRDIIILKAQLQERDENMAGIIKQWEASEGHMLSMMKEEVDGKMVTIESKEDTIRALQDKLAAQQELGIRTSFEWQAKVAIKDEEIDRLLLDTKEKLTDAEREGARKLSDCHTKLITKDEEIKKLSYDERILREKLSECIGRLQGAPTDTIRYKIKASWDNLGYSFSNMKPKAWRVSADSERLPILPRL